MAKQHAKHKVQRLQLNLIDDTGSVMKFQIGAQSYRGKDFAFDGRFHDPDTGVYLISDGQPQNDVGGYSELFVKGTNPDADDQIMEANQDVWSRIVGAVQAFNKAFMGASAVKDCTG